MASDLRSVSGRRLNFQKTQLEIRFNIPPRKSAVKNGVKNAVKKKVKNFSRETILKKLTEKSTEKFTDKSTDEFTGTSAAKIHSENRRRIPQKIQRRRKIHRRINQSIIDYVDSKPRGRRPGTWCRGLSWNLWLRWGLEPTMWSPLFMDCLARKYSTLASFKPERLVSQTEKVTGLRAVGRVSKFLCSCGVGKEKPDSSSLSNVSITRKSIRF